MPASSDSAGIVCHLDVFAGAEATRHRELMAELEGAISGVEELEDGFLFILTPRLELFGRVAEWVELERRCCSFFSFALEWASGDDAPYRLRLTGPEGTKGILRPLAAAKRRHHESRASLSADSA